MYTSTAFYVYSFFKNTIQQPKITFRGHYTPLKSIVTDSYKTLLAQSFIAAVPLHNYYLCFHKGDQVLFAKKILPEDVSLGTKKYKIGSGGPGLFTAYSKDTPNLTRRAYFGYSETLLSENVYKLLSRPGSESISTPSTTQLTPYTGPDNYVWKYMYSVPISQSVKFITKTHVPIIKQDTRDPTSNVNSNVPPNGHGFNAIFELHASSILINSDFNGSMFAAANMFDSLSLLKNPFSLTPSGARKQPVDDIIYYNHRLQFSSPVQLKVDDEITIIDGNKNKIMSTVLAKLSKNTYLLKHDVGLNLFSEVVIASYNNTSSLATLLQPGYDSGHTITLDPSSTKTIESKVAFKVNTIIEL